MTSVEKEGMKLYEKLASLANSESERLQESMEDLLATVTLGNYRKLLLLFN